MARCHRKGVVVAGAARAFWLIFAGACAEPMPIAEPAELTASPWLSACGGDDDCPSSACVSGLCTLACDVSSLETCASVNPDAVCDTGLGACDVPCGVALACLVLGPGYVCEENRCRAGSL